MLRYSRTAWLLCHSSHHFFVTENFSFFVALDASSPTPSEANPETSEPEPDVIVISDDDGVDDDVVMVENSSAPQHLNPEPQLPSPEVSELANEPKNEEQTGSDKSSESAPDGSKSSVVEIIEILDGEDAHDGANNQ